MKTLFLGTKKAPGTLIPEASGLSFYLDETGCPVGRKPNRKIAVPLIQNYMSAQLL